MAEKNIKSRIVHKHDVESNWILATNFTPKQGELIVYDIDTSHTYERVKVGDGKTLVSQLPFVDDALRTELLGEISTAVSGLATEDYVDAVQTALDTHTENEDIHVTSHAKAIWDTAGEHALSSHARVDATSVVGSSINGNIVINDVETTVYSHPNSGVSAGAYKSVTVNAQGHVTGGSNPTTLAGYGITDAEAKGTVSTHNSATNAHSDIRKSISDVSNLVGTTAVADQISAAIGNTTADDFGIYVQAQEPTEAVAGDIWIDTANDPTYIPPTIPEITAADNGKVLMVVNGKLQLVNLNLSVDANGVLTM